MYKNIQILTLPSRRSAVGSPITILINNAGIMPAKKFLKLKPEDVEKIFKVNVFSQYWTLNEFLPEFLESDRGHVVSMCSVAGITGTPNLSCYCSSKFAVRGLMDALESEFHSEYPETNVKMTTIFPFTVNTGLAHDPTTR
jgi:all-trans-retinol dehydrogenase (NAD+)